MSIHIVAEAEPEENSHQVCVGFLSEAGSREAELEGMQHGKLRDHGGTQELIQTEIFTSIRGKTTNIFLKNHLDKSDYLDAN